MPGYRLPQYSEILCHNSVAHSILNEPEMILGVLLLLECSSSEAVEKLKVCLLRNSDHYNTAEEGTKRER